MTIEQSAGYMPFRPTQEIRSLYNEMEKEDVIRRDSRSRICQDRQGGWHEYIAHFLEVDGGELRLIDELTAQNMQIRAFKFGDTDGAHLFTHIAHPNLKVDMNTYHEDTFILPPGALNIVEELMAVRVSRRTSDSIIVREMAHVSPAAYWALRQAGHIRPPIQK
jgi:hypothetical protein